MGNTVMRAMEGEDVNLHTYAFLALLKAACREASPPLISIAFAVHALCEECPTLGAMLTDLLAGKSPQEVADATSFELPEGVTAGEMGQA